MASNTGEKGADVSAPDTKTPTAPTTGDTLIANEEQQPLAFALKILHQADQLRLLQRAILRRNHSLKRLKDISADQYDTLARILNLAKAHLFCAEATGGQVGQGGVDATWIYDECRFFCEKYGIDMQRMNNHGCSTLQESLPYQLYRSRSGMAKMVEYIQNPNSDYYQHDNAPKETPNV